MTVELASIGLCTESRKAGFLPETPVRQTLLRGRGAFYSAARSGRCTCLGRGD